MHPLRNTILDSIKVDIGEMVEEGHDRTALLAELDRAVAEGSVDALMELQEELWRRPSPPDFAYDEPSDWESISATFPHPDSHARFAGTDEELADRLHAAWLGRCVGCQLGKPLEGTKWPDKMRETLEFVGSWPLVDYINPVPEGATDIPDTDFCKSERKNGWARGRFDAALADDDLNYAMTGQLTLEKFGVEFTSEQMMDEIVTLTPFKSMAAAAKNMCKNRLWGMTAPTTAVFGNPWRQSLGAAIRCDPFGWAAPANPALAARMNHVSGVCSQTRNGVYSGIFFGVLLADTLAHGDPIQAIETATLYVPPKSRFAEMLRFVKDICRAEPDWEEANAAIYAMYPTEAEAFNHSIPNAAIVIMSLLKGEGDFTRTLGISVMAGMDTDCNGATAGSIMGCALGTRGIPEHWTKPLNDTMRTTLAGMPELRISEVAKRMYEVARHNARR